MKTKILTLALAVLTIGLLGSCEKEDPKISVTCVSLDKTELTITVGDPDVKLTATVAPENATDKSVNWSSNAESVATVDQEGNVTAVAPGDATITVTTVDGGMTATCDVKVKAALPAGALAGEFSVSATKKVHFSHGNLYWDGNAFKFETNQYDVQTNWNASHVSHFAWCNTASVACEESYSESGTTAGDVFFTNATTESPNMLVRFSPAQLNLSRNALSSFPLRAPAKVPISAIMAILVTVGIGRLLHSTMNLRTA